MSDPATCSDSPSALSTSTSITGRALNLVSSAFVSRMSTARLIASRTSFAGSAPVHSRQRGSAQLQPFMYSGAVAASWSLTAPDSRGGPVQPIPPDCPVHWVGVPLCGAVGLPILSNLSGAPALPRPSWSSRVRVVSRCRTRPSLRRSHPVNCDLMSRMGRQGDARRGEA
jgi:hypothetical protein